MMFLLFLIGVLSVFTQVFVLREVYLIFSGNELSSGILLSSWMVWIGVGVLFSRRRGNLFLYSILYTVVFPFSLFLMYLSRRFFHILPGEVSGLPVILFTSFVLLAPLFFILGCIFGRGMREWELGDTIRGFIKPYMLDSFGDLTGGLLFSYFAIVFVNPIFRPIISLFLAITIPIIFLKDKKFLSLYAILIPLFFLSNFVFEKGSKENIPWKGRVLVEDTAYNRYTLLKEDERVTVYENGSFIFSYPDRMIDERVHIPFIYRHNKIYNILFIGIPSPGEAEEALKHGRVSIVQPDKKLPFNSLYPDSIEWIYSDPLRFVINCRRRFDFVFLRSGLPYTLLSARFFTEEFSKRIKNLMSENGIFVLEVPSSENYIAGSIGEINNSVYSTFKGSFKYHDIIPGESAIFLFSSFPLNPKEEQIDSLPAKYGLGYLTPFYLRWLTRGERHQYVVSYVKGGDVSKMRKPILFYLFLKLWADKYSPGFKRVLSLLKRIRPIYIFIVFLIPLMLKRIGYSVAILGGLGIGVQLLSIFGFQMISGGAYIHIGLLVGLFMLGLGIGSYLFEKFPVKRFSPIIFASFLLLFALEMLVYSLPPIWTILLFFVNLSAGLALGYTYGAATISLGGEKRWAAALVYFLDLIGGAIGSLIVSLILIPINGISPTIFVMMGLSMAGFIRFLI